jgi:hypothetical protein
VLQPVTVSVVFRASASDFWTTVSIITAKRGAPDTALAAATACLMPTVPWVFMSPSPPMASENVRKSMPASRASVRSLVLVVMERML